MLVLRLTHPHLTKENHASVPFHVHSLEKGIANGNVSVITTSCFCHAVPSDVQRMHAVTTSEVHMPAGSYSRIASSLTFCPAQLLASWSS